MWRPGAAYSQENPELDTLQAVQAEWRGRQAKTEGRKRNTVKLKKQARKTTTIHLPRNNNNNEKGVRGS